MPLTRLQVGVNVPLIVRLEGTNVERGKEILKTSGERRAASREGAQAQGRDVASPCAARGGRPRPGWQLQPTTPSSYVHVNASVPHKPPPSQP